jgi:hypothetical protein
MSPMFDYSLRIFRGVNIAGNVITVGIDFDTDSIVNDICKLNWIKSSLAPLGAFLFKVQGVHGAALLDNFISTQEEESANPKFVDKAVSP